MSLPNDDQLRRMALFRRLTSEDRARVAAVSRVVHHARGNTVFSEGEDADAFLAIVEGRVKVYKSTPAGKEIILEIFGPGDPLAAVAVYESAPLPASALALDDVTCLRVEKRDFFELLERHPALVRGLLSGLTIRLAELTRRLAELTGARVEARFARLFLKLAHQIGRADRGGTFVPMPLARQELADLTGTTIESAIRIMSRWGKEGLVLTEGDGFVIPDVERLRAHVRQLSADLEWDLQQRTESEAHLFGFDDTPGSLVFADAYLADLGLARSLAETGGGLLPAVARSERSFVSLSRNRRVGLSGRLFRIELADALQMTAINRYSKTDLPESPTLWAVSYTHLTLPTSDLV